MIDELQRIWVAAILAWLWRYLDICLVCLRKTRKTLIQDSRYSSRNSNWTSSRYQCRTFPRGQPVLVLSHSKTFWFKLFYFLASICSLFFGLLSGLFQIKLCTRFKFPLRMLQTRFFFYLLYRVARVHGAMESTLCNFLYISLLYLSYAHFFFLAIYFLIFYFNTLSYKLGSRWMWKKGRIVGLYYFWETLRNWNTFVVLILLLI